MAPMGACSHPRRSVVGLILLLPAFLPVTALSRFAEPAPIPYTVCVEFFFQNDDLLRSPERMQRRLERAGVSAEAVRQLASLKVRWDQRRDASRAEFSARWDPLIADGTVDNDAFLDDAARQRRELFVGFAEEFDQYLEGLPLSEATAVKSFLREGCSSSLVIGGGGEGWALAERRLEEEFLGIIGGEAQ